MFDVYSPSARHVHNPTGKFISSHKALSSQFQEQTYRNWEYQVTVRQTGVTRRRTVYGAVIRGRGAAAGTYLQNHCTVAGAAQAARSWIDDAEDGRSESRRRYDQKVVDLLANSTRSTKTTRKSQTLV